MNDALFEKGLEARIEVLGKTYVQRAFDDSDEFSEPFQEFITQYCWGTVWNRDGLPRQTRSLLTLAVLTALSKPAEVRTHVRGALNNGCSPTEIFEVLLQATVYCGVPAGLEAMKAAQGVIAEHSPEEAERGED